VAGKRLPCQRRLRLRLWLGVGVSLDTLLPDTLLTNS